MPIGLTATGVRNILDGKDFDKFFPVKAVYGNPIVNRSGSVEDAVKVMAQVAEKYKSDTALLAPYLKGRTIEDTTRNIWNFIYTYIQYREDDPGIEQIRRPLRSWIDRKAGVDCDCMSVFASSILKNLGIAHYFRITKYGKPDFQHVYVIVPKQNAAMSGTSSYITIDGVIDAYNKEKIFTANKDFDTMSGIPISVLNGLGANSAEDQQLLDYLVRTRSAIERNPATVQEKICPCDAVPMLTYVIDNWADPHSRSEAIEKTAKLESENFPNLKFFQTFWAYMAGNASAKQVMSASYLSSLGELPPGAIGPELPSGTSTAGSGNWWSNWGSGVTSFAADLFKTGLTYDMTKYIAGKNQQNNTNPNTTNPYLPGYYPPVTPTVQAGMSTQTMLLTIGVLAAVGFSAYSAMANKPKRK